MIYPFDMILITAADNQVPAFFYDPLYLHTLLETASYDGKQRAQMERDIDNIETQEEYDKILFLLQSNQMDRITSGFPYSATDIKRHLKRFM
jgi:hypothetical protein